MSLARLLPLVLLAATVSLAGMAGASQHCNFSDRTFGGFTFTAADCEEGHHNAAMGVGTAVVAAAAAGLGAAVAAGAAGGLAGAAASAAGPGSPPPDPEAPYGRTADGWPLGHDGRPVPGDWQGEPMIVSDGGTYIHEDGTMVAEGLVWYVDPDNEGHWLPRAEAEAIVAEERAAAREAEELKQEAHERTFDGYEARKREHAEHVARRDRAADAETRGMWDKVRALGDRLRRRAEALTKVQAGEAEQAAAQEALDQGTWKEEAWDGIVQDTDELVSYETLRQAGLLTRHGLDRAHEELTDPENWQVVYETTRDSLKDAARLAVGDEETERKVAENLAAGAKTIAKVGAHMATHPVETAKTVVGYDNWEAAFDPDVPVRERAARVIYGVADAAMNVGGAAVKAGDAATDLARSRGLLDDALRSTDEALAGAKQAGRTHHGIRVADKVEDYDDARHVLLETNHAVYEPKTGGAVWSSKVPGGQDPTDAARSALGKQTAQEVADARRAVEAAEASGDAKAVAAARQRLDRAEDAQRWNDEVEASFQRAKARGPEGSGRLDRHKGASDPTEIEARKADEMAAQARSQERFEEFETSQAELARAKASGDADAIAKAEDRLHRATMEAQRDKGTLGKLKADDTDVATKVAFNESLRSNLYDKVDDDIVRWAQDRFDVGETRYIGEAEPGMKVFVNEKTGERIMIFEPTNPKPGVSVGADRDFVVRVGKMENGKLVVKDAPSHEARAVYERSVYKNSRAGEYWADESADEVMRNLDQMITDARHREAYGKSPGEFRDIITDPGGGVPDPGQIRGVVADKSNHWYNEALERPDRYEEYMAEGMRQSTKQWDNQIARRLEALERQGHKVKPPKVVAPDGQESNLGEVMELIKERRKSGATTVEIEQELARYTTPEGRPMTPRLASQRAGEFWEEMDLLKARAAPTPNTSFDPPPVGAAVRLAGEAPEALEAWEQGGGSL